MHGGPPSMEGGFLLLRWVSAEGRVEVIPPTTKRGTHPPWGVGPRAWCPESNFPTAKNKRPPSRRLLPLLTVVTAMMAVA